MSAWQPKIFVDLDDVLAVFVPYVLNKLGARDQTGAIVAQWDYEAYPADFGWNFVGAANHLIPGANFTSLTFWQAVTQEIWATVPRAAMALDLLELCADVVGKQNVGIITSLADDGGQCYAGKKMWIRDNLPKWIQRQVLFSAGEKQIGGGHGRLLIDDAAHNCAGWEQAGGEAILWARPWNNAEILSFPQLTTKVCEFADAYTKSPESHRPAPVDVQQRDLLLRTAV